ncbi:hypothetical protein SAMN05216226_102171 [Halovenus aranensis]|uniref:Uncharacterized protein n=1 Tax=Halovenus aranensis TaxID=890420 RepID=A0A1G8SVW4_9EURY|nr:hypothetical protein [Halovenus aranensis]SDJ33331.1 hypothetical protein SAMN05216226_102171 [Halovenus aranensis]
MNQASTTTNKRFVGQPNQDLDEISDPHTIEDDSKTSLTERIRNNWIKAAFGTVFGVVGLAIALTYTSSLYPELAGNRYVRLGVPLLLWTALIAYAADQRRLGLLSGYDWLVLSTEDGPVRFVGEAHTEGTPTFVPYKGFDRLGRPRGPYTVEEVNERLPDTISNHTTDADDPARIRLHPAFVQLASTDLGHVITQETTALASDYPASEATHHAPEPELIRQGVSEELKRTIEQEREEVQQLRDEMEMMRRQLQNAKDNGAKTTEEMMEEFLEFYERIEVASSRSRTNVDTATNGDMPVGDTALQTRMNQVEQEVTPDDD